MTDINSKLDTLKALLGETKGIVIGYSGGVDSTLLATVATEVLGDRAVCVLASSQTYPQSEVEEARRLAAALGLNLREIDTDELSDESFARNTPDRCYFCKTELFSKLIEIAHEQEIEYVADGANVDDLDDYRPGSRAAAELKVRSPLREAGFTKADIREAAHELRIPNWDKPSFACLSSRIPYGTRIEPDVLEKLEKAESFLKSLGFRQVRVRHHGTIARIEVEPDEIARLASLEVRNAVVELFENLGYTYTTLDLSGYRMGSMNRTLKAAGGSDIGR